MVLNTEDLLILNGVGNYSNENSQLNDNHILEFNNILKIYTRFNMQSTINFQRLSNIQSINRNNEYLQILFSGNNSNGHWICLYYNDNIIHIYDSINKKDLDDDHKIVINRLFPNKNNLRITFEQVQNQTNSYDCGIFAIAFAVAIVFNICPCSVEFDISKMRQHLYSMYDTFNLSFFPLSSNFKDKINYDTFNTIPNERNVTHSTYFIQSYLNFDNINFEHIETLYTERLITEQKSLFRSFKNQDKKR